MLKLFFIAILSFSSIYPNLNSFVDNNVTGDYVAEVKFDNFMDESDFSDMEELGLYISDITIDATLNLTDDNNFTFAFDTTKFKDDLSLLVKDNIDSIIDKSLEDYGMSRDDFTDEVVRANGYDNADAFFDAMKNEMTTAMNEAFDEFDNEMEECAVTGTYKVFNSDISFISSDEEDIAIDEGTIGSDGSITIVTDYEGEDITLVFEPR